jgi:Pyruvate/2-oxoacid:ferredoxin oxidoreductase delta subunit
MSVNNMESSTSDKGYRIQGQGEKEFLARCRKMPNLVVESHLNSQQEGFEYFFQKFGGGSPMQIRGRSGMLRFIRVFVKYGRKLMKGRSKSYKDIEAYLLDLEENGRYSSKTKIQEILNTYPNKRLWLELQDYARNKWDIVKIGFTHLPQELIFKDKMVLFQHALIFMQEMKKEKIDQAPGIEAGDETMRVYASLGEAVADIAEWLRSKGIRSQAVHPLGGLVCTPPLAGKAGIGGQGRQGCLITPEFGPRQRLAPIFIEEKIFDYTDNNEHKWIQNYCKTCGNCQKNCPADAIYDEKIASIEFVSGIGAMRTCIDRDKCFPYFGKTLGCSICIKVCPFSGGPKTYEALKKSVKEI